MDNLRAANTDILTKLNKSFNREGINQTNIESTVRKAFETRDSKIEQLTKMLKQTQDEMNEKASKSFTQLNIQKKHLGELQKR